MKRASSAAVAIVVAGLAAAAILSRGDRAGPTADATLPADCGANPSAYHAGTLVDWPATGAAPAKPGAAGAELYARVRFETGRMVLAYNATTGRPDAGRRVVVAEIRCVNRTIHLLTELGAP